jgi:hypothetical protein
MVPSCVIGVSIAEGHAGLRGGVRVPVATQTCMRSISGLPVGAVLHVTTTSTNTNSCCSAMAVGDVVPDIPGGAEWITSVSQSAVVANRQSCVVPFREEMIKQQCTIAKPTTP